MMDQMDNDEPWSLFPLHENLTNSYVEQSKLLSYMSREDESKIGMHNFRSQKPNPLFLRQQSQPIHLASHKQQNQRVLTNPISFSNPLINASCQMNQARQRWKLAAQKVKKMIDPWASELKLDSLPAENAVRHRYNAIEKKWIEDQCVVKIDTKQFACGAMRACFRLKKLSNSCHKGSWEHASNYVAKSYLDPEIPRERYFDDVKLQMEAKLWAEIYNHHNPPKKIDMFQVSIIEFKNRPDSPLFHLEHYIDGKYIKYNSNSGFVEHDDQHVRFTPQAFSHFTFECSNHELIVVDVQGVGDLYTDPQIHTAKGTDYGDGNLGIKGFALFFSSHICNPVS
jgi:elongation factor 2 kinase